LGTGLGTGLETGFTEHVATIVFGWLRDPKVTLSSVGDCIVEIEIFLMFWGRGKQKMTAFNLIE
jgi:hypothetical protein